MTGLGSTSSVLWFFVHRSAYPCPLVVATANSPAGPFTILGAPSQGVTTGGDLALYKEPNGQAYLATGDSEANKLVFRLAADCLSTDGPPTIAVRNTGKRYEAASMAIYKGKHIVAGSYMAGLDGSGTSYAVADAPMGSYSFKGLMSQPDTKTWESQLSSFFYVAESDRLIAVCEQWFRGPKGERVAPELSSQLWLPVAFDRATGVAKMQPVERWDPWEHEDGSPNSRRGQTRVEHLADTERAAARDASKPGRP